MRLGYSSSPIPSVINLPLRGKSSESAATTASVRLRMSSPAARSPRTTIIEGSPRANCSVGTYKAGLHVVSVNGRRTSPTTPTTSSHLGTKPEFGSWPPRYWPIGSAFGQSVRASVSLTIPTRGESCRSRVSKSRPCRSGMRSVAKYPGDTSMFETQRCRPSGANPSRAATHALIEGSGTRVARQIERLADDG